MSDDPVIRPAAIRGEALRVSYRGKVVLDVPEVSVAPGSTYALLGSSGAGKSTLLRVLGLLERPTSGRIFYDGMEARGDDLKMRRTIAAVFQKPYLLRGTVGDNAGYGLRLRGIAGRERADRVAEALERVGLGGWEKRSALTLSGGEAQRVALARALVLRPSFLLLDEPLSYLDPLLKRTLTREFAEILASEHLTALYVTHDQDEAAVVADVIGVMREGRIVSEGLPDDVLGLPADEWLAAFVGMEPPLRGTVTANEGGLLSVRCGDATIFVQGEHLAGAELLIAVRPEDVTLYQGGADLPSGSARNRLDMTVAEVRPQGGSVQVIVEHGGVRIAAAVSRASAAEMGLHVGTAVAAVFKATAVRTRAI
ncbi:MAG: ABC transporter ATP-binding protein [Coriobacteriia bacterium]|nr:ABC transporter ATP-binding protein [Coriobacteriia bacterium]